MITCCRGFEVTATGSPSTLRRAGLAAPFAVVVFPCLALMERDVGWIGCRWRTTGLFLVARPTNLDALVRRQPVPRASLDDHSSSIAADRTVNASANAI